MSVRDRTTLYKARKDKCVVQDCEKLTIESDYAVDWAIVQTQNWSTLYILSRERQPAPASIDVSVDMIVNIATY